MPSKAKAGEASDLCRLLDLVSVCPSKQQLPRIDATEHNENFTPRSGGFHHQSSEALALDNFSKRYEEERAFASTAHSELFCKILSALVKYRLCNDEWVDRAPAENIHRIMVVLRMLLRETAYQGIFVSTLGGLTRLCAALEKLTHNYLLLGETPYIIKILVELTNILQKLSNYSSEHREQIVENGAHKSLVMLLSSGDITLLHCTLYALQYLALSERPRALIGELHCIEQIMHILQDYDLDSKRHAAKLLKSLCDVRPVREMLKVYDGLPLLLGLLNGCDLKLLRFVVWCIVQIAEDSDTKDDLRQLGAIPLLINLLQDRKYSNESDVTAPASATIGSRTHPSITSNQEDSEGMTDQVFQLKSACCAALTQLIRNDHNSQQIVANNGIYVVGMLILPPENGSRCKALEALQKSALRTLRFLFSMERNRRMFRRMFQSSPDVFGAFIDVGHYVHPTDRYQTVVDKLSNLPESDLAALRENISSTNQQREVTHYIEDYAVLELLGSGAFGSVYKVRKRDSGQTLYALKEVNLNQALLGKTAKDREKSVGEMISEITIIREQLKHPNIVKYYKTFVVDSTKLYVLMELIDGAPLGEHFNSLKEKGEKFTESRIWNIFIQIVLALRYLHKEKNIVHRDLSPNNIMLGENDKVTITDFGLAKHKQMGEGYMKSCVGTIVYSCPEIVQNHPYGDNADVWAIGCILYQMCALVPPFSTNNMLALARRIVGGEYDPLPDGSYSKKISDTIARCLTVDPKERPDIIGVAAFIADEILSHVETLRNRENVLERKLEKERKRTQKHSNKAHSYMKNYQKLFIASQERYDKLANSQNLSASSTQLSAFQLDANNNDKGLIGDDEEEPSSSDSSGSTKSLRVAFLSEQGSFKRKPDALDPLSVVIPGRIATRDSGCSSGGEPSPNYSLGKLSHATRASIGHLQRSCSTPTMDTVRQPSGSKTRPGSSGAATLSISPRKVRQIKDPSQQILLVVYKLIYISQLPPCLVYNPRRSCIDKFRRSLFSNNSNFSHLKAELKKLASGSPEIIDISFANFTLNDNTNAHERQHNFDQEGLPEADTANGITYEQMLTIIELVLMENDYYSMSSASLKQRMDSPFTQVVHSRSIQ